MADDVLYNATRGISDLITVHGLINLDFADVKTTMSNGGTGDVTVGARTVINSGCVIYTGHGVTIGDDVAVAANCVFAATNHAYKDKDRLIREQRFLPSRGGIIVEDDVWIGAGVILLDGAIVRQGAVIGAGSLVRGEVPAYAVATGNPLSVRSWRR